MISIIQTAVEVPEEHLVVEGAKEKILTPQDIKCLTGKVVCSQSPEGLGLSLSTKQHILLMCSLYEGAVHT